MMKLLFSAVLKSGTFEVDTTERKLGPNERVIDRPKGKKRQTTFFFFLRRVFAAPQKSA